MGANGTLTTGTPIQTSGETFSLVEIVNGAGRSGGSVNAKVGQFVAVNYQFKANTLGGNSPPNETTNVTYKLTLT